MKGARSSRRAVVLAALAALSACGTRLDDDAFVAAGRDPDTGEVAGDDLGPGTGNDDVDTDDGAGGGTTTTARGGSSPGATTPGGGTVPNSSDGGGGAAVSGPNQASDVGITETTVRLGTIVAENGVLGDAFAPAVWGLRAWVEYINAEGGINGRTVELYTCDDREDRARSLECARRLVEQDQVFALVATNSRALGGAAQYLEDQGIPVIGNPITNSFYRYSHFYTVYGTFYPRDGSTVADNGQLVSLTTVSRWFAENLGASKAAVFSYDIAESAQAGDFIQHGLELEGFTVSRYVVSFAAPSFDAAVADMQRQGTEVVFDAMDDGANRRLCDAMARRQFTVQAKVSTIVAMGDSVGTDFNDSCRPVTYIAGDSLPYSDTSHPFIATFNEAMDRYQRGKERHQWSLEAWLMATMVQEGLVSMGAAPTRAGLEAFLMGFENDDLGGVMTPTIGWQPQDLSVPTMHDCISVAKWDDDSGGWISAADFPYCIDDAQLFRTPVAEQGN